LRSRSFRLLCFGKQIELFSLLNQDLDLKPAPLSQGCDEIESKKVSSRIIYCPTALLIAVIVEVKSPARLNPLGSFSGQPGPATIISGSGRA